jgi:hypothetical protein
MKIWIEELGCIKHKWIQCEDGIARQLGSADEPDEVIIERARKVVERKKKIEQIENELRAKYPNRQIFQGFLPTYDVFWDGEEGEYLYVLKDRKKGNKYQVLAAKRTRR